MACTSVPHVIAWVSFFFLPVSAWCICRSDFAPALMALALMAWAGARIEAAARTEPALASDRWQRPLTALAHWVLPEATLRAGLIRARCAVQPVSA